MRAIYPLIFSIIFLLGACKKDAPMASLPRISQEGLNTGGFLLDGVAYPATGWPGPFLSMAGAIDALEGGYTLLTLPGYPVLPEYKLHINSEQAGKYVTVTLFLRNPGVGEFKLNHDNKVIPVGDTAIFDHATVYIQNGTGELYTTSAIHTGRVTMSKVNRPSLAAGTFEFTAISNLDPSKTIRVTEGRFDRRQ